MPTANEHSLPPPKSRKTLKSYFQSGNLPTQQNFADLIDSMVNRLEDGSPEAPPGGETAPPQDPAGGTAPPPAAPAADPDPDPAPAPEAEGPTPPLTFYRERRARGASAAWALGPHATAAADGLSVSELAPPTGADLAMGPDYPENRPGVSRLHLQAGGNVGIGTTTPTAQLEVAGFVASQGRLGTYTDAQYPGTEVAADGQWHHIISGLDGLHAFEIVAAAYGAAGGGRYAITHATALSAFGTSNNRIYYKHAWFWGWFQKIQLRWTGSLHNYGLDIRSASSFGAQGRIVYHITHLFDDRRPLAAAPAAAQ